VKLGGAGSVVRGEAAAAVDRHLVAPAAEQHGEREREQLRLEVPQRDVHRGDRGGGQALAAEVAHLAAERLPGALRIHGVAAAHRLGEHARDQRHDGGVGVGVAQPGAAAGLGLYHHQGGGGPGQRAVGFRPVGRNGVGGGPHSADRRPWIGARHRFLRVALMQG
jgi:hypothetical protein